MKITNKMRFMLVMLSVLMVLSLFACAETPEETTTKAPVETTEKPTETTEKTEPTEAPVDTDATDAPVVDETTDADVAETTENETESESESETASESATESDSASAETTETETTEAPACDHAETEVDAGKAATCTEDGLTDGSHCAICGAVVVAQETIPAKGHAYEGTVTTEPTCVDKGVKTYTCANDASHTYTEEIDANGHTDEAIPGKPATCTEDGLTDGVKCSVCGVTTTPQETISAKGHTVVDKAWTAPTTAEDGWEAHKACANCDMLWNTEGEEIDSVPAIAKIVPTTEKYWGAYELSLKSVNSSVGSTFKPTAMATDRTYVRFERDGTASRDGAIYIADNKDSTEVTGQYLIFKYRTDHVLQVELFATTEGGTNGQAHIYPTLVHDEQWHIVVINLADQLPSYVLPEEDGTYVLTWSRIDIFDSEASEGYFDMAWMVTCDDPSEVASIMQKGDIDLCPHVLAAEPEYENDGDNHSTTCAICGDELLYSHSITGTPTWNTETKTYTGTCVCGASVEQSMLYVTEASCDPGKCNSFLPEVKDGFVRYTNNGTVDPYVHFYVGGNVVTGKYVVIKYRVSKAGLSYNNSYVGSAAGKHATANAGCDANSGYGKNGTFVGDGEWHYLVIEAKSECFAPNEDGTYTCRFFRIGLAGFSAGDYLDIEEIAFASELDAAENYAYTKETNPPYKWCIDNGANTGINGATASLPFTTGAGGTSATGVVDMKDSGEVSATNGVAVGGWVVTPGGTKTYKYRVTVVDGVAVENPTLIDGWTVAGSTNPDNGIVKQGTAFGWTTSCGLGSGWQGKYWLNLLGYEGKTITVEIVAITNYGAEVVFLRIENINIAAEAPNYVIGAKALSGNTEHTAGLGLTYALSDDGKYVTYTQPAGAKGDQYAYITFPNASINVPNAPTGQYIMFKYRTTYNDFIEIFVGANNGHTTAIGSVDNFKLTQKEGNTGSLIADGEWHYIIMNVHEIIADFGKPTNAFAPEDGTEDTFILDYLRIDFFNEAAGETAKTFDLAFVVYSDSVDKLVNYAGMDSYTYVDGYSGGVIYQTVEVE